LLTLLRAAANKDRQTFAIFAEINPVTRAEVDFVLE
jgi:hypothetical protein